MSLVEYYLMHVFCLQFTEIVFYVLQGLGGRTRFHISMKSERNKVCYKITIRICGLQLEN